MSLVRQVPSPTSLIFLVVAIIAIAASFAMFVRYRETDASSKICGAAVAAETS